MDIAMSMRGSTRRRSSDSWASTMTMTRMRREKTTKRKKKRNEWIYDILS
jgi:hypothetical protein